MRWGPVRTGAVPELPIVTAAPSVNVAVPGPGQSVPSASADLGYAGAWTSADLVLLASGK